MSPKDRTTQQIFPAQRPADGPTLITKESNMEMLAAVTQFLAALNSNHFAAVALIALVAVANRRPPKE